MDVAGVPGSQRSPVLATLHITPSVPVDMRLWVFPGGWSVNGKGSAYFFLGWWKKVTFKIICFHNLFNIMKLISYHLFNIMTSTMVCIIFCDIPSVGMVAIPTSNHPREALLQERYPSRKLTAGYPKRCALENGDSVCLYRHFWYPSNVGGILSFFKFASRCDKKRHESSLVVALEEVHLVSCDWLVCSFSLTHVSKRWITILLQTNPGEHDKKTLGNHHLVIEVYHDGIPFLLDTKRNIPKKTPAVFEFSTYGSCFHKSHHCCDFVCLLSLVLHNPCHLPTAMSRPWSPANVTLGETEAPVIFGLLRETKHPSLHTSDAVHER